MTTALIWTPTILTIPAALFFYCLPVLKAKLRGPRIVGVEDGRIIWSKK